MNNVMDLSLVDWSRGQFALTAIYHWLFVPLTLGLGFIVAIMESIYIKTGEQEWKRITKFWMTLFGINFAIGIATGIILEFEFGTNWSNYSWFVGDIFGAPLAIEGIMAFFLESTFIAVMFFGWNKVSKRFHLLSTWLVAVGASLSALWILIANAWMQYPAGMHFNPDTARNEMINFWEILFSPLAINKFLHTISSGFVLASVFVSGISAWYLLKNREHFLATRSLIIASVFGLVSSLYLAFTGDISAKMVAQKQPMKFAAMECFYEGQTKAPLKLFGIIWGRDTSEFNFPVLKLKIEIPDALSYLAYNNKDAFVPGIRDLLNGNPKYGIMSAKEKMERGKIARLKLRELKEAYQQKDSIKYLQCKEQFADPVFQKEYFAFFGYAFFDNPKSLVPNITIAVYSFHAMILLGFYFIFFFIVLLWLSLKNILAKQKLILWIAVLSIPLPYIAGQAGWILAEAGRQPWVIQDYLPTLAAVSQISTSAVKVTFWLFAVLFTVLLIAEIKIMTKQIKLGPKEN
jgi:cytochrome bd ubiquinol oxidase subunit I